MFEHALDENRARKGVKDQKSQWKTYSKIYLLLSIFQD